MKFCKGYGHEIKKSNRNTRRKKNRWTQSPQKTIWLLLSRCKKGANRAGSGYSVGRGEIRIWHPLPQPPLIKLMSIFFSFISFVPSSSRTTIKICVNT